MDRVRKARCGERADQRLRKEGLAELRAVVAELVHRADDVTDDGTEHLLLRFGCGAEYLSPTTLLQNWIEQQHPQEMAA